MSLAEQIIEYLKDEFEKYEVRDISGRVVAIYYRKEIDRQEDFEMMANDIIQIKEAK